MAEGSELRQQCLEVVHGDKPYRDVDLQRLEAWVDDTTKLIDFFSLPPETRKQIVAEAGEWP
jgi:hypothetical protein